MPITIAASDKALPAVTITVDSPHRLIGKSAIAGVIAKALEEAGYLHIELNVRNESLEDNSKELLDKLNQGWRPGATVTAMYGEVGRQTKVVINDLS